MTDLLPTDDEAAESARELAARGHAGRAVRDLGHAIVGHNNPEELLEMVAMSVEAMAVQLAKGSPRSRPGRDMQNRAAEPVPPDGQRIESHPDRPISGAASPWGVDLVVTRDGDEAVGVCTLRAAHEGAPGRSHGGVVAATFDDLFGFVLTIHQAVAFTGELTIRYVAGTPLFEPIEFRARLVGRERRKLYITGEARASQGLIATATSTFISLLDEPAGAVG